jgi:hypothetical protein
MTQRLKCHSKSSEERVPGSKLGPVHASLFAIPHSELRIPHCMILAPHPGVIHVASRVRLNPGSENPIIRSFTHYEENGQ